MQDCEGIRFAYFHPTFCYVAIELLNYLLLNRCALRRAKPSRISESFSNFPPHFFNLPSFVFAVESLSFGATRRLGRLTFSWYHDGTFN